MPPLRMKNIKIINTTRERIIDLLTDQGLTMASVAHKLSRGGNRGSRAEQTQRDWLTENMDEFVGRPVQWLATKLNEHFQIEPPIAQLTVDKAIKKLTAYTLKLMRVEPTGFNLHITRKFYKTQKVQDAITTSGHTFLLLPSYSLHLNAAKSVFSSVETHVSLKVVEAETLAGHVASSLAQINAAMARGWN
ncbi:hypothetical protein K457DRAFT_23322 [Linnemannia elongata AG-77]|uniref:Tc1-like transposase DDE domain-containing protein n=1 Tax=Linnemannia elongata AG-77 TaxID=1314771 RepID=A0A197JJ50_9FUNG|nr:hypothetical protein K457DRAFT_23322 [Linnemannia elongata AG-77]